MCIYCTIDENKIEIMLKIQFAESYNIMTYSHNSSRMYVSTLKSIRCNNM